MTENQALTASVTLTNTGKREGEETVQLYIRDLVGSVTRPVRELKGFQKITLKAGESRTISFKINASDLAFYKRDMTWGAELGKFQVFIGANAETTNMKGFELK